MKFLDFYVVPLVPAVPPVPAVCRFRGLPFLTLVLPQLCQLKIQSNTKKLKFLGLLTNINYNKKSSSNLESICYKKRAKVHTQSIVSSRHHCPSPETRKRKNEDPWIRLIVLQTFG